MKPDENEFAIVSISDEGAGIPPEMQTYIFDDFFHPDAPMKSQVKAGGVGMGLSVVRSLIDAYNGRIWLESKPNEGSTFFFLIASKTTRRRSRAPSYLNASSRELWENRIIFFNPTV